VFFLLLLLFFLSFFIIVIIAISGHHFVWWNFFKKYLSLFFWFFFLLVRNAVTTGAMPMKTGLKTSRRLEFRCAWTLGLYIRLDGVVFDRRVSTWHLWPWYSTAKLHNSWHLTLGWN